MYCTQCGARLPDGRGACQFCGTLATASAATVGSQAMATSAAYAAPLGAPPVFRDKPRESMASDAHRYAGFWLRFVAAIIDWIVISIGSFVGGVVVGAFLLIGGMSTGALDTFFSLVGVIIVWLYYALMESSPWQATLGKKALGLVVTDGYGDRISFRRATARHWAKVLSNLTIGIGYIMAGFTSRKQALHDKVATTLVVKR